MNSLELIKLYQKDTNISNIKDLGDEKEITLDLNI